MVTIFSIITFIFDDNKEPDYERGIDQTSSRILRLDQNIIVYSHCICSVICNHQQIIDHMASYSAGQKLTQVEESLVS